MPQVIIGPVSLVSAGEEELVKPEEGQEEQEDEEHATEVEELCASVSSVIGRLCAVGAAHLSDHHS